MSEVYVVTGGTRGIGAAVTRALAGAAGRTLVVGYRSDEAQAEALVEATSTPDCPVIAVRCDVANEADVAHLFEAADAHGRLVGLVNSAGVLEEQTTFTGISADRWRRVFDVNVVGTASCCRAAVTRMLDAGTGGSIVNVSSRAAVLGSPGEYVDYAASKAAVDTLTRGLALEVAPHGVRVNAVRPGIIRTEMHASGGEPGRADRLGPAQPIGRAGEPGEVADAIAWLLSPAAAFVTGTHVDVSGGR